MHVALSDCRPEVRALAVAMEQRLRQTHQQWDHLSPIQLARLAGETVDGLVATLVTNDSRRILPGIADACLQLLAAAHNSGALAIMEAP